MSRSRRRSPSNDRMAFAFGVAFIIVILIIAVAIPNPSPFAYIVFRVVLALAAAGIAAIIPGLLEIRVSNFVKAGGAIAVFVIIYFYSPAVLRSPDGTSSSGAPPISADTPTPDPSPTLALDG